MEPFLFVVRTVRPDGGKAANVSRLHSLKVRKISGLWVKDQIVK